MASAISANKAELLAIANSVASEKMIDKAIVIEAMEEAIQKSARNRYGAENDIRAKLDPLTGDLRLVNAQRRQLVVVVCTEGGLAMSDQIDTAHVRVIPEH